jgi:hypothetical protein
LIFPYENIDGIVQNNFLVNNSFGSGTALNCTVYVNYISTPNFGSSTTTKERALPPPLPLSYPKASGRARPSKIKSMEAKLTEVVRKLNLFKNENLELHARLEALEARGKEDLSKSIQLPSVVDEEEEAFELLEGEMEPPAGC